MIDILNKSHTVPRFINNEYLSFLFRTFKVEDIDYLFFKKNSFPSFCNLITSAEREVKDSCSSGMFQICIRISGSCFGISWRYLRGL